MGFIRTLYSNIFSKGSKGQLRLVYPWHIHLERPQLRTKGHTTINRCFRDLPPSHDDLSILIIRLHHNSTSANTNLNNEKNKETVNWNQYFQYEYQQGRDFIMTTRNSNHSQHKTEPWAAHELHSSGIATPCGALLRGGLG